MTTSKIRRPKKGGQKDILNSDLVVATTFLAVQDSSIRDLVTHSVSDSSFDFNYNNYNDYNDNNDNDYNDYNDYNY